MSKRLNLGWGIVLGLVLGLVFAVALDACVGPAFAARPAPNCKTDAMVAQPCSPRSCYSHHWLTWTRVPPQYQAWYELRRQVWGVASNGFMGWVEGGVWQDGEPPFDLLSVPSVPGGLSRWTARACNAAGCGAWNESSAPQWMTKPSGGCPP